MHIFHQLFHTPAFLKESLAKNFVQSSALLLGFRPAGRVPLATAAKELKRRRAGEDTGPYVQKPKPICRGGSYPLAAMDQLPQIF